jgi:TPR repeat protein
MGTPPLAAGAVAGLLPKDDVSVLKRAAKEKARGMSSPSSRLSAGGKIRRSPTLYAIRLPVSWYRKAALRGHAEAQNNLGGMHYFGHGVPQDYAVASSWYRKEAMQGNAEAQNSLGNFYINSLGVPPDYAAAVSWYRKAAEQGFPDAQHNLGVVYTKGWGVPQDYAAAVSWYRKAATQGNAEAQCNLGVMYGKGQGVPKDYIIAHMWFNLAAARGDANAVKGRNLLAAHMTPALVAEAQTLAREWEPK